MDTGLLEATLAGEGLTATERKEGEGLDTEEFVVGLFIVCLKVNIWSCNSCTLDLVSALSITISDTLFLVDSSSSNISFWASLRGATAAVTSARIVEASSARTVSATSERTTAATSLRMVASSVLEFSVMDFLKPSI